MRSVCLVLARARDKGMHWAGFVSLFSRGMISRVMSVCSARAALSCLRVSMYSGVVPGAPSMTIMWELIAVKKFSALVLVDSIIEIGCLWIFFKNGRFCLRVFLILCEDFVDAVGSGGSSVEVRTI